MVSWFVILIEITLGCDFTIRISDYSHHTTYYLQNGQKYNVKAKKEVILSAGAINSPQLLLLSGIGPKNHLNSVGIRTVVDLPGVGENLHNHASYGVDFTLKQPNVDELNMDSANLYFYNQTGPMSSTGLAQLTGILTSNYTTADDPDIQIFFAGYQAICDTNGRIPDLNVHDNNQTVRFSSVNIRTLSRGKSMIILSAFRSKYRNISISTDSTNSYIHHNTLNEILKQLFQLFLSIFFIEIISIYSFIFDN